MKSLIHTSMFLFIIIYTSTCTWGCSLVRSSYNVEVIISEKSPWESTRNKQVWYLLRWNDPDKGICEQYLRSGLRGTVITIAKGGNIALTAYPAGKGIPLGGFIAAGDFIQGRTPVIRLRYRDGAAAETLQRAESFLPGVILNINGSVMASNMRDAGTRSGWDISRVRLYYDILTGSLGHDSFTPETPGTVQLSGLPPGFWIPENPAYPGIQIHTSETVTVCGFHVGEHRYMHNEQDIMLVIISQGGSCYWYLDVIPPDFLL